MEKIGIRIRKIREQMSLSLTELAARVGVTKSCLSQIEKCKSFPSLLTLKQIANVLDTTVGELIGENEKLQYNPIMRKADRKIVKVNQKGTELHLMSHHDETKKMETFFIVLPPGGDTTEILTNHTGEEFCYVINGTIEVTLDDKVYTLTKGDCAYYNSNINHLLKNVDEDISRFLLVVTPPNL